MKHTFLKTIGTAALAFLMLATFAQIPASAQQAPNAAQDFELNARPIEGVFDARVSTFNCQTGAPIANFRAMDVFHRGGTLTDTNAGPPTSRGPGFGTWRYLGGQLYTASFQFFRFNPDGTFAGSQRVIRPNITLSADGNQITGNVYAETLDPNDVVVAVVCGTSIATRVNSAPTISITSPASGVVFNSTDEITIIAAASDSDGQIVKVEFFYTDSNGQNRQRLSEDFTAPYSYSQIGAAPGTYIVTAVATDDRGASAQSNPITVIVR
ncbi:MAG: Ig-like domain-containing protein [Pyrinomonadaceae bacterium]